MEKTAQLGMSNVVPGYQSDSQGMPQQDVSYAKDKEDKDEEVMFDLAEEPSEDEIVFILPTVPGALDDSDIIVDEPSEIEVQDEEPKDVVVEDSGPKDPWDWQSGGLEHFTQWLHDKMHNLPSHSGKDEAGIERICAIFEALLKETSKAMRQDFNSVLDASKVESARDELHRGLDRLHDRLEKIQRTKSPKKKKKADESEDGIVKQSSMKINGISIVVPLFVSAIVRVLINGYISAGRDMFSGFELLNKKYKFSESQKLEIITLLEDSGYPLPNLDRGRIDEDMDFTSETNPETPTVFRG